MKVVDKSTKNTFTRLTEVDDGDVVRFSFTAGNWIVTDEHSNDTRLIVCLEDGAADWVDVDTEVTVVTNAKIVIGSEKEAAVSQANRIDIFGDDVDDGSDKSACGDCGACGDRCSPAKEMVINDTIVKLGKKKDKKK